MFRYPTYANFTKSSKFKFQRAQINTTLRCWVYLFTSKTHERECVDFAVCQFICGVEIGKAIHWVLMIWCDVVKDTNQEAEKCRTLGSQEKAEHGDHQVDLLEWPQGWSALSSCSVSHRTFPSRGRISKEVWSPSSISLSANPSLARERDSIKRFFYRAPSWGNFSQCSPKVHQWILTPEPIPFTLQTNEAEKGCKTTLLQV